MVWAGGDARARLFATQGMSCVLSGDYSSPEALERLAWWLAFHLRLGFRWCFLYVADAKTKTAVEQKVSWIGSAVSILVQPSKDESVCARDATARARLAGASWLLRLAEHELLYVLPRTVFRDRSSTKPKRRPTTSGANRERFST